MSARSFISIYIHWPFCRKKCNYCNFNSYTLSSLDEDQWTRCYLKELASFRRTLSGKNVKSIYFGGGTPSLMPPKVIEAILKHIDELANIKKETEITIEVNPTLFEQQKLKIFRELGINRVSIGIQALNDSDLKILGREHSVEKAISTIELVQKIFDNYSFDLIYGRHGQTLDSWQAELHQALKYIKHHISLYQLTIEPNTLFDLQYNVGKFKKPSQELEAQMFEINQEILETHGIHQYEISNFATHGKESIHNLAYWNYNEYLGIGPGAHSRAIIDKELFAISIEEKPPLWLKKLENNSSTIKEKYKLSNTQIAYEYILMNLRKTDGINIADFYVKFNKDIYKYLDKKTLNSFQIAGWLQYTTKRISITKDGRIFLDKIIKDIIKTNANC